MAELRATLFATLFLFTISITAQKNKGEAAASLNESREMQLVSAQLAKSPEDSRLNYRAGILYLASRSQKHLALAHLRKAYGANGPERSTLLPHGPQAIFDFAEASAYAGQYDHALAYYQRYLDSVGNKSPRAQIAHARMEHCRFTRDLLAQSLGGEKFVAVNATLNPQAQDFPDRDLLYFSPMPEGVRARELVIPAKPNTPRDKIKSVPDTVMNISTLGASPDGQLVATYNDERGNFSGQVTALLSNIWSAPSGISPVRNDAGWEGSDCISADGNVMYFVSSRAGGMGGKDIYRCTKMRDGTWSKAENAGPPVNSTADDEAPLLMPDGKSLYFSSNRNDPKRFDNYYAGFDPATRTWSAPEISGYPSDAKKEGLFYQTGNNAGMRAPDHRKFSRREIRRLRKDTLAGKFIRHDPEGLIPFQGQKSGRFYVLKGKIASDSNAAATRIVIADSMGKALSEYRVKTSYCILLPDLKAVSVLFEREGFMPHHIYLRSDENAIRTVEPVHLVAPAPRGEWSILPLEPNHAWSSVQELASVLIRNPEQKVELVYCRKTARKKEAKQALKTFRHSLQERGVDPGRVDLDTKKVRKKVPGEDKILVRFF